MATAERISALEIEEKLAQKEKKGKKAQMLRKKLSIVTGVGGVTLDVHANTANGI